MIPSVVCSECELPMDSQNWEARHDDIDGHYHDGCCPAWECRKGVDTWTPGSILDAIERDQWNILPVDWEARLLRGPRRSPFREKCGNDDSEADK